jgi:DNA-directed RNA polymerase beta' subunit
MVFNATFNNISVISRGPVLLMEETGVPGESRKSLTNVGCCVYREAIIEWYE